MKEEIRILRRLKYKNKNQFKNDLKFKYTNILIKSLEKVAYTSNKKNVNKALLEYTKNNLLQLTSLIEYDIRLQRFLPLNLYLLSLLGTLFKILHSY